MRNMKNGGRHILLGLKIPTIKYSTFLLLNTQDNGGRMVSKVNHGRAKMSDFDDSLSILSAIGRYYASKGRGLDGLREDLEKIYNQTYTAHKAEYPDLFKHIKTGEKDAHRI